MTVTIVKIILMAMVGRPMATRVSLQDHLEIVAEVGSLKQETNLASGKCLSCRTPAGVGQDFQQVRRGAQGWPGSCEKFGDLPEDQHPSAAKQKCEQFGCEVVGPPQPCGSRSTGSAGNVEADAALSVMRDFWEAQRKDIVRKQQQGGRKQAVVEACEAHLCAQQATEQGCSKACKELFPDWTRYRSDELEGDEDNYKSFASKKFMPRTEGTSGRAICQWVYSGGNCKSQLWAPCGNNIAEGAIKGSNGQYKQRVQALDRLVADHLDEVSGVTRLSDCAGLQAETEPLDVLVNRALAGKIQQYISDQLRSSEWLSREIQHAAKQKLDERRVDELVRGANAKLLAGLQA